MNKAKNTTAVAGIAGAVIGAGVTAAAVALSDKDTRKKVKARLFEVKKQAEKALQDVGKKADDVALDTKKTIEEQKK